MHNIVAVLIFNTTLVADYLLPPSTSNKTAITNLDKIDYIPRNNTRLVMNTAI